MSLFSWEDVDGTTKTLDVDVVMTSGDRRTAKLTDHVVESGAVITDHVIIQPEVLTLELLVTQTPITGPGMAMTKSSISVAGQKLDPATIPIKVRPSEFQPGGFLLLSQGLRSVVAGITNALLGGAEGGDKAQGSQVGTVTSNVNIQTLQATTPTDRVANVHDKLVEILTGALLVTVSFKGRLYQDYLLTLVELENKPGEFGMGRFKVEARAFRTVTGVSAQLPTPADFRTLASVPKGNKSKTTPDPDPNKATFMYQGEHSAVVQKVGAAVLKVFGAGN